LVIIKHQRAYRLSDKYWFANQQTAKTRAFLLCKTKIEFDGLQSGMVSIYYLQHKDLQLVIAFFDHSR
ncbi:MAG: hypothetical protein IKE43_03670, partial [Coriobacteriales bacterium]|nr:hypothetical protein [Coriobacteriales bacterium]